MNAKAKIQLVIDYIEAHPKDEISIADLAKIADYSPWHLYSVFKAHTGMPVMEYIRLRRLNSAVQELAQGRKLYDIAMDYCFDTQAGFYKAFERHFGCSPTRYRVHKLRQANRQFPPILIDLAKGGSDMQDRVVIRVVKETDAESLWENVYSRDTPKDVRKRIASNIQQYSEGKCIPLVAEVDGHAVGTMHVSFEEHPLRSHICTLFDVVVNPVFQRMGISRRLLEECKTHAADKGKSLMLVSTRGGTPAETVYRKLGFTEYGRLPKGLVEQPPYWDVRCEYDEVFFYLPLTECA